MAKPAPPVPPPAPAKPEKKKPPAYKAFDARVGKASGVAFSAIQDALQNALTDAYPEEDGNMGYSCKGPWIRDTFDDSVVYNYDGGLFQQSYTFDGTTATLGGSPTPVMVSYVPASGGAASGAPAPSPEQAPPAASAPAKNANLREIGKRVDVTLSDLAKKATPRKG